MSSSVEPVARLDEAARASASGGDHQAASEAFLARWRAGGGRTSAVRGRSVQPYPGLRSFWPSESDLFFGRERQTQELLDAFGKRRVTVVLGGSGSGKSSLVRAGVVPRLSLAQVGPDSGAWYPVVFQPGEAPSARLFDAIIDQIVGPVLEFSEKTDADQKAHRYAALRKAFGIPEFSPEAEPASVREACRAGLRQQLYDGDIIDVEAIVDFASIHLHQLDESLSRGAQAAPPNVLLFVDQFEEAFVEDVSEDERRMLISLITQVWRDKPDRLYMFVAMRSEELHRCSEYEHLADVINGSLYLVNLVGERDLREAIVGPARRVLKSWGLDDPSWAPDNDAPFTPAAMALLRQSYLNTANTAASADRLPLMQHLLTLVWDRAVASWAGHERDALTVDVDDIEHVPGWGDKAGPLLGALDAHADTVFKEAQVDGLDQAERGEAERTGVRVPTAAADAESRRAAPDAKPAQGAAAPSHDPAKLPRDVASLLHVAFYAMTRRDDRNNPKRNYATLEEILLLSGAAERERERHGGCPVSRAVLTAALERFRVAGLIEVVREGEWEKYTVSHEAFIRGWAKYRSWFNETQAFASRLLRIDEALRTTDLSAGETIRLADLWRVGRRMLQEIRAARTGKRGEFDSEEFLFARRQQRAGMIVSEEAEKILDHILGPTATFSRAWARDILTGSDPGVASEGGS